MVLEIYKKDTEEENEDDSVKVKYDGEYIPLCDSDNYECSVTEFKERLKFYSVSDEEYKNYCFGSDDSEGDGDDKYIDDEAKWAFIAVIIVESLAIAFLLILFCMKRK